MLEIDVGLRPGLAAEVLLLEVVDVRGAGEAHQVGDAGADRRRPEASRVGDDPFGHEAAVAPPEDAEAVRIGDAHRDHPVDAGHQVAVVASPPVVPVREAEGLAAAGGAARVGSQQGKATRRQDRQRVSPGRGQVVLEKVVRRSAVDDEQQRHPGACTVAHGVGEQTLDLGAVGRLPGELLGAAERRVGRRGGEVADLPRGEAVDGGGEDFRLAVHGLGDEAEALSRPVEPDRGQQPVAAIEVARRVAGDRQSREPADRSPDLAEVDLPAVRRPADDARPLVGGGRELPGFPASDRREPDPRRERRGRRLAAYRVGQGAPVGREARRSGRPPRRRDRSQRAALDVEQHDVRVLPVVDARRRSAGEGDRAAVGGEIETAQHVAEGEAHRCRDVKIGRRQSPARARGPGAHRDFPEPRVVGFGVGHPGVVMGPHGGPARRRRSPAGDVEDRTAVGEPAEVLDADGCLRDAVRRAASGRCPPDLVVTGAVREEGDPVSGGRPTRSRLGAGAVGQGLRRRTRSADEDPASPGTGLGSHHGALDDVGDPAAARRERDAVDTGNLHHRFRGPGWELGAAGRRPGAGDRQDRGEKHGGCRQGSHHSIIRSFDLSIIRWRTSSEGYLTPGVQSLPKRVQCPTMSKRREASRHRSTSSAIRSLGIWAIAWSLLLSGLVLHNGIELHDAFDGVTHAFLTGAHPHPGTHFETAAAVDVPACPACLLQLQSIGDAVPQPQQLASLICFGAATTAQPRLVDLVSPRLAPSRGPPPLA